MEWNDLTNEQKTKALNQFVKMYYNQEFDYSKLKETFDYMIGPNGSPTADWNFYMNSQSPKLTIELVDPVLTAALMGAVHFKTKEEDGLPGGVRVPFFGYSVEEIAYTDSTYSDEEKQILRMATDILAKHL